MRRVLPTANRMLPSDLNPQPRGHEQLGVYQEHFFILKLTDTVKEGHPPLVGLQGCQTLPHHKEG